jgi:hypothetical protein
MIIEVNENPLNFQNSLDSQELAFCHLKMAKVPTQKHKLA